MSEFIGCDISSEYLSLAAARILTAAPRLIPRAEAQP